MRNERKREAWRLTLQSRAVGVVGGAVVWVLKSFVLLIK